MVAQHSGYATGAYYWIACPVSYIPCKQMVLEQLPKRPNKLPHAVDKHMGSSSSLSTLEQEVLQKSNNYHMTECFNHKYNWLYVARHQLVVV